WRTQNQCRLESLGRGDRGHQLREKLPRGLWSGDRPEGPRRAAHAAGIRQGQGPVSPDPGTSQLADRGQGHCVLSGPLTLASVPWLWKGLETPGLLADAREADLSGVHAADSAGLALLMAWKAHSLKLGGRLSFSGVPQNLLALAALTDAQAMLVPAG